MKNKNKFLTKIFSLLMLIVMGFGAMSFTKTNTVKVYAFEMGDTLTIEDLINTCRAFPNRSENAWKNESSDLMFVDGSNKLHLKNGQSEFPDVAISITEELSFDSSKNEYYYDVYNGDTKMITCHFNLTNGILTSIEAEERFWQAKEVCGTYEPQPSIYVVFDGIGGTLNKASRPINGFALYTNEDSYLLIREPQVQTSKVIFNVFNFPEEESANKYGENQIIFDSCYTFDYLEYSLDDMNYTEISDYDFYYEDDDCDCKKFEGLTGNIYIKPVLKVSHNITTINGLDCSCDTDGYKVAYKCSNCNKYYEDEACSELIGDEAAYNDWILGDGKIPALGHSLTEVAGKSPTCTEDGYMVAYKCSACEMYFSDPAGEHEIGNETAYNAWKLNEGKIQARHVVSKVSGVDPTKERSGYKEAWKCSECGQYFEDEACTVLIGDETAYNAWKSARGYLPQLPNEGISAGAIVGICVGSTFFLLLVIYLIGYFFLYRKGKLDEKKIRVIYKFLPRDEKNLKEDDK